MTTITAANSPLRVPAVLLLAGQLLYIGVTLLHAGGEANDHPVIFATYAANTIWTTVHLGQFVAMAIMLAGLFALAFALDARTEAARWASRLGAMASAAALALYGALQAVDGVALKHAVDAWASAPAAEQAARFASAETLRWLEWGMRSYQDFALGLALVLFGVAAFRSAGVPRVVAVVMALAGVTYVAQGWISGTEGFTQAQSTAIVLSWVLDVLWMIPLAVVTRPLRFARGECS